ncbi:class I SAM-dependent methyltransferase [Flavobacterium aciduliphilum]|uniref:Thiopurine S-methyltransferase n=1 Tax=Flavobacterium aciduliphilum TaxID=1101402 RepID=A0A328YRE0_9FLAO|nr:SAM-dependent methyltransferase [Flavobacterium aciduliphilum]RAR75703.1 thiopurine S-methyltransferase [Flavobacterium aciduliphilum]
MSLTKDYWENRYQNQETGWDVGRITTPLKEYFDQLENKSLKILIPGAGNSYEFDYLLHQGFHNVFVLDFAETPLQNIQERWPQLPKEHFIHDDFFEHNERYDLIIEQTFFCALDPNLRKDYVKKMLDLLNLNGKIAGLFFQFPLTLEGPPFGGSKEIYEELFQNDFTCKTLAPARNSIKPRDGKELFFIFIKK